MSRVHSAIVIAKTPSLKGCLSYVIRTWDKVRRKPRFGARSFPSGERVTVVFASVQNQAATPLESGSTEHIVRKAHGPEKKRPQEARPEAASVGKAVHKDGSCQLRLKGLPTC